MRDELISGRCVGVSVCFAQRLAEAGFDEAMKAALGAEEVLCTPR